MVLSRNRREAGILSSFSSEYDECILVVDDSVTEIGEKAFVCCYNLKGLIVPDTVIRIGKDAFYENRTAHQSTSMVQNLSFVPIGISPLREKAVFHDSFHV